jgi:hypothetical protein
MSVPSLVLKVLTFDTPAVEVKVLFESGWEKPGLGTAAVDASPAAAITKSRLVYSEARRVFAAHGWVPYSDR